MMKKYGRKLLIYTLFTLIVTFFCSCFEVIDKVKVKDDGSGSFQYLLNASQSKTRLNSLVKMGSYNGKKIPSKEDIRKEVQELQKIFENTPGISNVQVTLDLDNYILKITGNFRNIENIDQGLQRLKVAKKGNTAFPTNMFFYNDKAQLFLKNSIPTYRDKYEQMSTTDQQVFTESTYTSILQFDRTILNHNNSQYTISSNKKSLKNSGRIIDFIQKKKNPAVTIKLQ